MTSPFGDKFAAVIAEKKWLEAHPDFAERPATIREFVGADYLNNEADVRPGLMVALVDIFGNSIDPKWISIKRKVVFTGGIGIGKTTLASIVLPYMVHWVFCLKDPQKYFNLMSGTRIAFMMMSTSEKQAKEVLFGDVKARIENSPWFNKYCIRDPKFENQIRFPKSIWIIPGGSEETQFEGYNILGGILDEGDSHKQTNKKDYAEQGYDTIHSRIESRFMDHQAGKFKGLLMVIGQTKSATGFMRKTFDDFSKEPDALAIRMSIWESIGWHNFTQNPDDAKNYRETAPRKSFIYDVLRKEILTKEDAASRGLKISGDSFKYIEVPTAYLAGFVKNPQKALRDLAGIPPESKDPFVAYSYKITECQDMWHERNGKNPVTDSSHNPTLEPWMKATERLKRVMHIDVAYSAEGDALGIAMGHVPEVVDIDGEDKPLIVFDFLMRIHAAPGTEIILGDVRRLCRYIRDDLKYNLKTITMDGFESTDFMQQMRKSKFEMHYQSVDKAKTPYEDLRDGIYDNRILFPHYMTRLNKGDSETVDIAYQEISQLEDVDKKIDHPANGSKDVADAMAGVTYRLMGDSQYRRGAKRAARGESRQVNIPEETLSLEDFLAGKAPSQDKNIAAAEVPEVITFEDFMTGPKPFENPQSPSGMTKPVWSPSLMPGPDFRW